MIVRRAILTISAGAPRPWRSERPPQGRSRRGPRTLDASSGADCSWRRIRNDSGEAWM